MTGRTLCRHCGVPVARFTTGVPWWHHIPSQTITCHTYDSSGTCADGGELRSSALEWYVTAAGVDRPRFSVESHSYAALCAAASRLTDARHAVAGRGVRPVGTLELVAYGEALCAVSDRRIAHLAARRPEWLDELTRDGTVPAETIMRSRGW